MTVEKFSAAEIFSESTEAYVLAKKPNDLWYRYLIRNWKFLQKFTNFSNKIFVIFSNKWPSKNFRQPKIFRNQLKPTFLPKSLMIYGTDTLYGLKIFFILKISTKFTNFSNKIFVIFSNKWPSKNFRQPKIFRNQMKPTFLPKSLRIYGTDTLYGVKIGIKVENFRNFAKFSKNFTLFPLITPQRKKFSKNFFGQNVAKSLAENSAKKVLG